MTEYRVNDVDLQEFLHSFTDGDGKLPSDFEQLKREGHYLIHGDAERVFCLKEREIYLKDIMENLLARSICFFSNMPISYAVHVKASGRADITVLDNKRLAMEIKEKHVKGKSITVKYYDGTVDVGALKTEKYIKGPFGEKVSTIQYACVADSLLSLSREVYSLSYEAQNKRSLSAAVREIHRKREHDIPVKTKGFFRTAMEDRKLLLAIRQTRYLQGMPDESRILQFKESMKKEGYIQITPELAVQAKKFSIPRYTLQKDGKIGFVHDVKPGDKSSLFLMGKQWEKMLDILVNEKPIYCSKELLVAMKVEAKYEAANAKKKSEKTVFASIARKLTCFLEAVENHNLSHLLKENALKRELPDFLSMDEKEKLTQIYHFPTKEQTMVADQSTRYQEAVAR